MCVCVCEPHSSSIIDIPLQSRTIAPIQGALAQSKPNKFFVYIRREMSVLEFVFALSAINFVLALFLFDGFLFFLFALQCSFSFFCISLFVNSHFQILTPFL